MIKFLSGLFIGLLLAQAAADTRASVPIDNEASFRAAGRTPSGKYHVIQVDEDGYVIVRKNP